MRLIRAVEVASEKRSGMEFRFGGGNEDISVCSKWLERADSDCFLCPN